MKEEYQELIDKKLQGSLLEKENKLFDNLLNTDADFNAFYAEEKEIAESMIYLKRTELLQELKNISREEEKSVFQISWKKIVPIAAGLFFIVGLFWFMNPPSKQDNSDVSENKPNSNIDTIERKEDIAKFEINDNSEKIESNLIEPKAENDEAIASNDPDQNVNEPSTIIVNREISLITSRDNEAFGHSSNDKRETTQLQIQYTTEVLSYKLINKQLYLKGQVDTNAEFKLNFIKSLEGNKYNLQINEQEFEIKETSDFKSLID
jgi:hypothetical protein